MKLLKGITNNFMKKDHTRDYVVAMFRFYALHGEPDSAKIEKLKNELSTAAILDLTAVDNTLRFLENEDDVETVNAIRAVYFALPDKELRRGDISKLITKYAMNNYNGERTVWRKLARAQQICAQQRNLNI